MTLKNRLAQLEKRTQGAAVIGPTFDQVKESISLKLFGTAIIPILSDTQVKEFSELVKEMQRNEHT